MTVVQPSTDAEVLGDAVASATSAPPEPLNRVAIPKPTPKSTSMATKISSTVNQSGRWAGRVLGRLNPWVVDIGYRLAFFAKKFPDQLPGLVFQYAGNDFDLVVHPLVAH